MKKDAMIVLAAVGLGAVVLLSGCATTVGYRDAGEVATLNRGFGRSDLQQNVMAMVDSMLTSPGLQRKLQAQFAGRTPTISIPAGALRNETYQMGLNLASLTDSIRTKLINSGMFDFIDTTTDEMNMEEMMRDHDSALTDQGQTVAFGTQAVADYQLYGRLVEMQEEGGRTRESYYKLTMQLKNKRTGKLDWADEKEIRKQSKRPGFGM